MTEPVKLPETVRPINEDAIDPAFVEKIKASEETMGPVMTLDEFLAWLLPGR